MMDLPAAFLAFRKSRWFRVFYIVILALVIAALFRPLVGEAVCFLLFVIPLTMFVFPYWLGERSGKNYALNGFAIILVALLVIAVGQTQVTVGTPPAPQDSSLVPGSEPYMRLSEGIVEPFQGSAGGTYTFSVLLTTPVNDTAANFTVLLEFFTVGGTPENESFEMTKSSPGDNTRGGMRYELQRAVDGGVHGYGFTAWNRTGNVSGTIPAFGPITAGWLSFFGVWAGFAASALLFPLLFYFMFVAMWWFTRRMRTSALQAAQMGKARAGAPAGAAAEKAGKVAGFTCTSCGADVTETDEKCPKCGAVFED